MLAGHPPQTGLRPQQPRKDSIDHRRIYIARFRSRHVPRRPQVVRVEATSSSDHSPVVITGAGIAGLTTAVALHKCGVPVTVLEAAAALRQEGSAIALWSNAWRGLDVLGVGQQLRQEYQLLTRVELSTSSGRLLRSFTLDECASSEVTAGGIRNETRGVVRRHLLQALADQLPTGTIQFGRAVSSVASSQQEGKPLLQLSDGSNVSCDVLIGADGANSVVAQHLGLASPNYAGYVAYRGVAEYPPGRMSLPLDTIRQVWGAGVRAGMYPLTDKTAYWYICFNAREDAPRPSGPAGFVAEALAAVDGWSWDVQDAVRCTRPETISRSTIRDRWTQGPFGRGCLTLAGDSAHPMTPNLGQGGNTAVEDGIVLARSLAPLLQGLRAGQAAKISGTGVDSEAIAAVLRSYERERSVRCLPLTVRSYLFGAALQLPYPPVLLARDFVVSTLFRPDHFLDHTEYDCGSLPLAVPAMQQV